MIRKNLNELNVNVFNDIANKKPILVSGNYETGYNGMTVSWGGFGVLWNSNVFYLFVRKSRYSHEIIDKSDRITLSFLSDKYNDAKKIFGTLSGRDIDKFNKTGLHHTYEVDYDGYYIPEADYVLRGKVLASFDLHKKDIPQDIKDKFYKDDDIHTMYVCKIIDYLVNED